MAFLTAGESVDRIATYCRVEQLLFRLFGSWAVEIAEPQTKLAFLVASDHCGWRAQRWFEMLPTAPPGPDAFLVSTPAEAELVKGIDDQVGGSQAARVVVTYELLLPGLHAALGEHLDRTSAVADGPIQRMLAIAMTDIERDLLSGADLAELVGSFPHEPPPTSESSSLMGTVTSDFAALFRF